MKPVKQPAPAPVADHPHIDQWLSFQEEGAVRLRTGRVEIGQGVASALVQIAADELDVAPERIDIVAGDTRECPDEGVTSGSRSIEQGGASVRFAASAARQLLLAEAAKLLQAQPDALTVNDGRIRLGDRATDLDYWKLAGAVDLGVAILDHARPKAPSERRLVGKRLMRHDLPDKIKGAAFIHDLAPEGMLHGRVLHPPLSGAQLADLDVKALEGERDVVAVVRDGSFVGVVAETEEGALRAVARAERLAKWRDGKAAPSDLLAAMRATKAEPDVVYETGDVGKAQGRRVTTEVTRQYLSHASIGTVCALAEWQDRQLQVHTQSQGIYPLRAALAEVFGLSPDAITVIHAPGAGCYGHNGADDVALEAALLARAVPGRPVRVAWSRADELVAAPLGSGMVVRAAAVLDGDGKIDAFDIDVASQSFGNRPGRSGAPNLLAAAYLAKPFPFGKSNDVPFANGGGADRNGVPIYTIPNQRVSKRIVQELPIRTSSLRGLGAHLNVFAIETLMDDVAYEIGADPLELRLAHLDDARAREVLERTARAAGWPGPQGAGRALGLGMARYKNRAAYCAVAVDLEVEEEIRLLHAWSAVDAGMVVNPDGIANQIEGGIIQAASWTLKEAIRFEDGAPVTRDFETYPILHFGEVPEITIDVIDRLDEPSLGCGETSIGPMAAAIGNAVRRALGVRVRDLPMTRDAIIAAMS